VSQPGLLSQRIQCTLHQAAPFALSRPPLAAGLLLLLTLSLMLIGAQFADPYLRLAVGGFNDERVLVRFYELEQNNREKYRWSQPLAGVFLYGFDGRPARVNLRLISLRPDDAPPATVELAVGNYDLGEFTLGFGWRNYQVLVPTRTSGDTALLLKSSFFRPGGEDTRNLGVATNSLVMWPVGAAGNLPPPQRTFFLLTLPLLTCLLLWWSGVRIRIVFGVGIVSAGVAGLAAAYPLTSGYLLPTIWWPWWPFAPLLGLVVAPMSLRRLRGRVPFAPWSGLALMLVAVVALRFDLPAAPGLAVLLTGTLLALTGLVDTDAAAPERVSTRRIGVRVEAAALVGITLLAVGLRLYHLDSLPLGIWRDEARHASLALRIWNDPTFRPIYVVSGADLPALLFYLMAPIVGTFGPHVWSARLISALAGALTPLALWWAARPLIGARAALLSAALIAWASWSLSMSRWAFPATLDHLLMLMALGLMWRALPASSAPGEAGTLPNATTGRTRVKMVLLLGGAALCAGLAAYTYHTGRMGPITLAVLTAVRLGPSRANWRRAAPALAAAALIGLLTLAPLLNFIAGDWEGYNRRVARVSVLDTNNTEIHAPLRLLLRNAGKYLLMWHVTGEPNGRHHAPGAPMLDPIAGTLLLVGLGLAIARRRRPGMPALLLLPALNLLPGLFSGDAPHAMRSLGTLAPACMLAGFGLETLRQQAAGSRQQVAGSRQKTENQRFSFSSFFFILLPFLVGSLVFNVWLYFGAMAQNPAVYSEFYVTETAMARVARAPFVVDDPELQSVKVFILEKTLQTDALRYLTNDIPVESVSGAQLSAPVGDQALLLLPASTLPEVRDAALRAFGAEAEPLTAVPTYPQGERPLFLAYGIGDEAGELLQWTFEQ
jgi:4-amino-4-deoxy-L-arabinose transferase-like glycosyltransferase